MHSILNKLDKIRNERGDIVTNTTQIQRNHKQLLRTTICKKKKIRQLIRNGKILETLVYQD